MAHHLTRHLTFLTNDLGQNATLVLNFDNIPNPGQHTAFPVVWKVGNFGASGQYAFKVKYKSEFGFISGRNSPLGIVHVYTHINPGEKTTLTEIGNPPVYRFSSPSPIQPPGDQMQAENDAGATVDIGFGIFEQSDLPPKETLFYEGVQRYSSVRVEQLTPTLLGYISSAYKEGDILRTPIPFPVVFNENLATLDDETYWKLEINRATGEYQIIRA